MSPGQHHLIRRDPFVIIYDGRGTTSMLWEEFLEFTKHILTIAEGGAESASDAFFDEQEITQAESANDLLTSLGLVRPTGIKRRKL